jgi:hypothetical protein
VICRRPDSSGIASSQLMSGTGRRIGGKHCFVSHWHRRRIVWLRIGRNKPAKSRDQCGRMRTSLPVGTGRRRVCVHRAAAGRRSISASTKRVWSRTACDRFGGETSAIGRRTVAFRMDRGRMGIGCL